MKKPSAADVLNTFALRAELRKAAPLTNDPDKALEIADAWCQSLAFGLRRRDRGVFALRSEDVVGILLAAHHANPDEVDAATAVDAAATAASILGAPLRTSAPAATRWALDAATTADTPRP